MILGFNTDVRCGATVFHVQSEPRYSERLLQTQVFVGGRCIGKRSTSYASRMCEPGFFEEQLQDLLKAQHRQVVDAAREGQPYELLDAPERPSAPPIPIREAALTLEWTNADSAYDSGAVQMQVKITQAGKPTSGASVTSRLTCRGMESCYAQATADQQGCAMLRMPAGESDLSTASVLVQAKLNGSCVTKKFRLRRA